MSSSPRQHQFIKALPSVVMGLATLVLGIVGQRWLAYIGFCGVVAGTLGMLVPSVFIKHTEEQPVAGRPATNQLSIWRLAAVVVGCIVIGSGLSVVHVKIWPGPIPIPSLEEISQFASGATMSVGLQDNVVATGFYIHHEGYAVTCIDSEEMPVKPKIERPAVFLVTPTFGGHLVEAVGYTQLGGFIKRYNDSGLEIVQVPPTHPSDKPMTRIEQTAKREAMMGFIWILPLTSELPKDGEKIYLYGAEAWKPKALVPNEPPTYTAREGKILRTSFGDRGIRLYAQIPFRTSYCGAPVLNTSKVVIGMALRQSGDEVIVVPARYIISIMREGGVKM